MKSLRRDSQTIRSIRSSKLSLTNLSMPIVLNTSQSTKILNQVSINDCNNYIAEKENISHFELNKQHHQPIQSKKLQKDTLQQADSMKSLFQQPQQIIALKNNDNNIDQSSQQQKQKNNCQTYLLKPKSACNLHRRAQSTISLISSNNCSSNGSINNSSFRREYEQQSIMLSQHQQEKVSFLRQQKVISKTIQEAQGIISQKQNELNSLKRINEKLSQKYIDENKGLEELKKNMQTLEKQQIPDVISKQSPLLEQLTQSAIEREQKQSQIYQKLKQINLEREQILQRIDFQSKQNQLISIEIQKNKSYHMQLNQNQSLILQQQAQLNDQNQKYLTQLIQTYNQLLSQKK